MLFSILNYQKENVNPKLSMLKCSSLRCSAPVVLLVCHSKGHRRHYQCTRPIFKPISEKQ